MLSQTTAEEYWTRQRKLHHVVLLYLSANGPTPWDDLYNHFDPGETGEIGSVLRYLAQWMHISITDNIVTISELGAARLKNGRP
jgi:hypothetical protein